MAGLAPSNIDLLQVYGGAAWFMRLGRVGGTTLIRTSGEAGNFRNYIVQYANMPSGGFHYLVHAGGFVMPRWLLERVMLLRPSRYFVSSSVLFAMSGGSL